MGTETVYVGSSVLGAQRRGQICSKFSNGVRLGICYGERPDFVKNTRHDVVDREGYIYGAIMIRN
jgi:hypothetical protein